MTDETVKRYDMCCDYDGWDDRVIERESPDGDWVRHTDYAALAQQLADVAYMEAWMRDMRGRPHWDEHSRRFFADGHPEDGAEDLPALGALLRQREEGR